MTVLHPGSPRNRSKYTRPFSPHGGWVWVRDYARYSASADSTTCLIKFYRETGYSKDVICRVHAIALAPIVRVQYMPIYRESPGYSKDVIDSTPSQQKRDRPGYSRDVIDSTPSHQKRDKPGYSRDVIDSTQSHQKRDRPDYRKDVIDSTLSQQKRHKPGYSKDVIDSTLSQQKRDKPKT